MGPDMSSRNPGFPKPPILWPGDLGFFDYPSHSCLRRCNGYFRVRRVELQHTDQAIAETGEKHMRTVISRVWSSGRRCQTFSRLPRRKTRRTPCASFPALWQWADPNYFWGSIKQFHASKQLNSEESRTKESAATAKQSVDDLEVSNFEMSSKPWLWSQKASSCWGNNRLRPFLDCGCSFERVCNDHVIGMRNVKVNMLG